MEEILASIRRIISDDEAHSGGQDAAPEGYVARPAASEDPEEGIADTQIIADIERVLAGAGTSAEASEDEILDLTDLGVAAEAADEPQLVEELVVTEVVEEVSVEPGLAPSFAQAFPSTSQAVPQPAPAAAGTAAPMFQAAPQFEPPAGEPLSAMTPPAEDPTAALERAIEALKAGDLAAFARAAESKYVPPTAAPKPTPAMPEPMSQATLAGAGPTLAEQFATDEEPPAVLEEELVILSEPEPSAPVAEAPAWSAPETPVEPEAVSTPWHSDDAAWMPKASPAPEFMAAAPRTNGGSGHKAHDFAVSAPKSLEDSVKEMLRPMLRKWLDENMQRVLTQALREELEDPQAPRRDG
jgi:cell pole-organizing protein PopZ